MACGVDSQGLLYQKIEELPGRWVRNDLRKVITYRAWLINSGQFVGEEGTVDSKYIKGRYSALPKSPCY